MSHHHHPTIGQTKGRPKVRASLHEDVHPTRANNNKEEEEDDDEQQLPTTCSRPMNAPMV
jgi:hypothetical protein